MCGILSNSGQPVGEPSLWVDVVHLVGDNQAVHHGRLLSINAGWYDKAGRLGGP
jgi:hypothetical protein